MMRFLTLALLASAALPVAAHAQEDNERGRTGAERREAASVEVAQRGDRGGRGGFDRGSRPAPAPQADRGPRPDRAQFDRGPRPDRQNAAPPPPPAQVANPGGRDVRGDGRRGGRGGDGSFTAPGFGPSAAREVPGDDAWNRYLRSDTTGRGGAINRAREQQRRDWDRRDNNRRDGNANRGWDNNDRRWNDNRGGWNGNNRDYRNWDRGWRNDRRYDWQRYRNSNRGAYRLPRYYAPSGWQYGYRSFSIGATLFPGLFAQNYWISDPFYYRLPPAHWPYQWVRYYDDALLVDTRSGFVVDVIPGIFW